ncbi:MAG: S8 family serine peptidase [candidate division WOR-3 bacterium]
MSIILLFLCLWPRPEMMPVGRAEVTLVPVLERSFESGSELAVPHGRSGKSVPEADARIPGQYVVGFMPGYEIEVRAGLERAGVEVVRLDQGCGFFVCHTANERLDLPGVRGVRYIEPDVRIEASRIPNDPFFLTQQWDKWVMYSDKAWDIATGATGVKVAVIDNGVEYWHPDLAARFVPGQYGRDFVRDDDDPRPDNSTIPEAFHGTHVAGIIAAVMDNGVGVAGWAQVQLVAVRVLNDSGSGDLSDLASGIRWAVDRGCRVLNMSLGANQSMTPLEEACRYAAQNNVVLFGAAGNAGAGTVQYPAALPECVCVGALDEYSGLADFSNYGAEQELVAPGVSILSTTVGGSYALASGTSMACPEATGVAALLLSAGNSLSASRVRAILAASAIDKGLVGRDEYFGYGLVNAARAMQLAVLLGQDSGRRVSVQVIRGPVRVVDEADEMMLYDCQGRFVARVSRGQETRVNPGSYFALLRDRRGFRKSKFVVLH